MAEKKSSGKIIVIVAVVGLVLLCLIAAGTYWAVGPQIRCALSEDGPSSEGWTARNVRSGDRERCYFQYTPSSYDPDQPMPLVISFHGFLSNPNSHGMITGWQKLAEREGFLLVYPQGTKFPQRWDSGPTWGDSDVDDVQFFNDILTDVTSTTAVDPKRIYVNGFSNGGGMSVTLGCEAADKIAAVGSVAGAVVDIDDCNPSRPTPMMAFHGTDDPVVNYDGFGMQYGILIGGAKLTSAPVYFVGAEEWTEYWAKSNGCSMTPEPIPANGDMSGVHYMDCEDGAEVIFYTIDGGGHSWPGGWPIPFVGKTSKDINATEELWRFFQAYTLE